MEPKQLPQNSEEYLSPAEVTRRQVLMNYRAEMIPLIARLCWFINDDDFADLVRYMFMLSMGGRCESLDVRWRDFDNDENQLASAQVYSGG